MSDPAWAPPDSDMTTADWAPPDSDFASNAAPPPTPSVKDLANKAGDQMGSDLGYYGRTLAKGAANAVAALPLVAMDAGVAARNVFGKATGIGGTDYELPSQTWHQGMDQLFGAPKNTAEKVNDAVIPMLMGAAGASSQAPGLVRAMMSGPSAAEQAPANFVNAKDAQQQVLRQTVEKGQQLGLVVPPQTTNPSLAHAAIESIGGKIQTAQQASVHNQSAANTAAIEDLRNAGAVGLHPDAPLTKKSLLQVIRDAGQGYDAVRNVGPIATDNDFGQTLLNVAQRFQGPAKSFPGSKRSPVLDDIYSLWQPQFDASHAVDKIDELRDAASMAYRQGDSKTGKGYKDLSRALEDQIDRGIAGNPDVSPDVIDKFRSSRVLAAKAHSVLDALNPATSDVSIQSLARSDDPLSGNLKTLADFGAAAPKATQDVAKIGSHGVSHLDALGSLGASLLGEHTLGPAGVALGAYPAARWGARAYALGPGQASALPSIESGTGGYPKTAAQVLQGGEEVQQQYEGAPRASGGRVDHNALVERLISRCKQAKRDTDNTTKPLLNVPDPMIVKALDIAGRSI